VRGGRSVRIVVDRGSIAVFGPGDEFRRHEFADTMTAMLEHATIEQQLVSDGWSLEQMTTERRSGADRRQSAPRERRRGFRLV
jgi:hypothetical protein